MEHRPIRSTSRVEADFAAVPSKSMTHRALVVAALASGESVVHDPLEAVDTVITRNGLMALGASVEAGQGRWVVQGLAGRVPGGATLALGESGTSFRFLAALAALGQAPSRLDGAERLRERPIAELIRPLRALGAEIVPETDRPGLPLRAGGRPLTGNQVRVESGTSSQFASALLLIGSSLPEGLDLRLDPPVVSAPYIELTAEVLAAFGVAISREAGDRWRVAPGVPRAREYRVEGDHSSASYLLAAAAIVGGRVRVNGLCPGSAQPDSRLAGILEGSGCRVGRGGDWVEVHGEGRIEPLDLDVADAPDLVPTLAVLAMFARGPSVLRGIGHLRHKESDRLEQLARNLTALGRPARAVLDRLEIDAARGPLCGAEVITASDHRIAMAFAVAGLRIADVVLDDADCVAKSHPTFWEQFALLET